MLLGKARLNHNLVDLPCIFTSERVENKGNRELMVKILNGKVLADHFCQSIKSQVENFLPMVGRRPCLGVILVGSNPASQAYVANKEKTAKTKCGFETRDHFLDADSSSEQVAEAINQLNNAEDVDGILLQLPLPNGLPTNELLDLILAEKDADGLHPLNQGLLQRGEGVLRPCTPSGVMALIDLAYAEHDLGSEFVLDKHLGAADLSGKTAVVIGRSILVGKPVASMLLERNATVISAHSKTKNIAEVCAEADILVAAVGRPKMVKANWVKFGAIVIDVGINRMEDGSLAGDVDFQDVQSKCFAITPVPGGVGPMTVAMLMQNTLGAYIKKYKERCSHD